MKLFPHGPTDVSSCIQLQDYYNSMLLTINRLNKPTIDMNECLYTGDMLNIILNESVKVCVVRSRSGTL